MEVSVGASLFRTIFAALDSFIYGLVGIIYDLIKNLATVPLFSNSEIAKFSTKIYGIMGLFMLFKVSFSMLNYIVDPDSFSDKSKGMGSIVKNIIIVLVLIILAPFAFDELSNAQDVILKENILERFIFSTGASGSRIDNKFQMSEQCGNKFANAQTDGDFVALTVFSAFYQPEDGYFDEIEDRYCKTDVSVTVNDYLYSDLYNDNGTFSDDVYYVDYLFVWSTIVGVLLVLLFLNVGLEIAKRVIKLGFLELIAPIPIISYVDPRSGKDGMFKKWLKELGSTWVSLFIRLGAIYFAIYIISLFAESLKGQSIWMKIFFVFGCMLFAKELPKLIEKLVPGLNLSGKITLNPIKNFRENALGGKAMFGVTSAGLGFAGGVVSNAWAAHQKNSRARSLVDKSKYKTSDGKWRSPAFKAAYQRKLQENGYMNVRSIAGSVAAGATSSGFRSFWNTAKSGKILSGAEQGITTSSRNRNLRRDANYGYTDRIKDKATDIAGVRSSSGTTSLLKNKVNENNFKIQNAKRDENAATYAMQEMAMADGGRKIREFMIAFEELSRNINKNTHGVDVIYKYKNYDEYATANAGSPTLLNREEYSNYEAALKKQNAADSLAHQLEWENETIAKQQNAYKGPTSGNK